MRCQSEKERNLIRSAQWESEKSALIRSVQSGRVKTPHLSGVHSGRVKTLHWSGVYRVGEWKVSTDQECTKKESENPALIRSLPRRRVKTQHWSGMYQEGEWKLSTDQECAEWESKNSALIRVLFMFNSFLMSKAYQLASRMWYCQPGVENGMELWRQEAGEKYKAIQAFCLPAQPCCIHTIPYCPGNVTKCQRVGRQAILYTCSLTQDIRLILYVSFDHQSSNDWCATELSHSYCIYPHTGGTNWPPFHHPHCHGPVSHTLWVMNLCRDRGRQGLTGKGNKVGAAL